MKQSIQLFRFSLCVIMVFLANPIFAQISAAKASLETQTDYTSASISENSIYIFCDNIGTGVGELVANSVDGTSGWTFTWLKWDIGAADFTIPVIVEANQSESTLTNLTDGLYKVIVSKTGETNQEYQAWVLNRVVSTQLPIFSFDRMDCVGVFFNASYVPDQLKYIDIPSSSEKSLSSTYIFELTREGLSVQRAPFVSYDGSSKNFFDGEAFEGENDYLMTVTDECGNEYTSSVISSETYKIHAEFSIDPMLGEAPLEVIFDNQSVNAESFEWFVYQDFDRLKIDLTSVEDSLLLDGILVEEDPTPYTYLHPGNYFVKLIASSDKGPETCVEEFYLKTEGTPIVVDTSLVQVPNVFTPNGDGRNDVFRVKSQSLKTFHAILLNRWGRVVYEWRNPEEGWNGKINGKWATPGTYFYVITATGREELKKKYTKKGSFMLIRK